MIVYRYNNIGFRPLELDDIELIRQMHNEPDTLIQMRDPWPVSPAQQRDWFEAMSRRRQNVTFMVCELEGEKPVGVWRLQTVDETNRVCEVGWDTFPAYRRQGFATQTARMLMSFLFDHYNIHMISLHVAEFNTKSYSVCLKLGYRETGRLVESIFRDGRYWDNILMCLTVEQYRQLYPKGEQP